MTPSIVPSFSYTPLSNVYQTEAETQPQRPLTPTKLETVSSDPSFISPTCVRTKELFKQAGLTSPKALAKAQSARNIQKNLGKEGANKKSTELPITEKTHCYVTKNKLFLTGEKAGEGVDSVVWFSDEIDLSTSAKPRRVVLKRSRNGQLKNESNLTQTIRFSSPNKQRKLNLSEEVFKLSSKDEYIGIFEPCQSNLKDLKYSVTAPASQVLPILRDIAEGLYELKKQAIVHCDIKGVNLLVTQEGGGSIGDFGFARKQSNQRHFTELTPTFAAPFIWKNIVDQKNQINGYQGEAADIFAFGVTLQFDVLGRMLFQLAKHYNKKLIVEKLNTIQPSLLAINPRWTDEDLYKIEETYIKSFQRIIYTREKIFFFIPIEKVLEQILLAINQLEEHITPQELAKMRGLAHVMQDLQQVDPRNLSADKALQDINALINQKIEIPVEPVPTPPVSSEMPLN
jgi:serine/threonine protein kinase